MMRERAGFGIRLCAALLDYLILLVLAVGLGVAAGSATGLLGGALHALGQGHGSSLGVMVGLGALTAVLATLLFAYLLQLPYTFLELLTGWTPGKLMLGLRVRSADGSAASLPQVLWRWLLKNVAVLLALLSLSGLPFGLLTPFAQLAVFFGCFLVLGSARQALHDSFSNTAVFENSQIH